MRVIGGRDWQRDTVKLFDPGVERLRNKMMRCMCCRHWMACATDYPGGKTASVLGGTAIFTC
ncbi:hypothetical protein ALP71_03276 [Pseudomonas coronafaciens pv. garcae]|nr:hypothetical protein ALP71_03276 [Pseudomonas coronafaciens pv. garcae]